MDLHCPAIVVCLSPGEAVPRQAGGSRVDVGYLYRLSEDDVAADLPLRPAPSGNFWQALAEIADAHRGEGAAVFAPAELLAQVGAIGATFSVDSRGPVRV